MNRRTFVSLMGMAAVAPKRAWARTGSPKVALYASVGPELSWYELDLEGAQLVRGGSVQLPADVQYAWPHVSGQFLFVVSSDGGPGKKGHLHRASAFRIDPESGALQPQGEPVALPFRPVHVSTDVPSDYLLTAYNQPSGLTVHRLNRDGTIGREIAQPGPIDAGIYAHQIRAAPSNRLAVLVTRGNDAAAGKPEDPGALKVFQFKDGLLTKERSLAPGGGYGFGPRHLDFHPSQPWVYVSLERQNQLWVFRLQGAALSSEPLFKTDTLADPANVRPKQMAGAIHLHPNGRFVYLANRADGTIDSEGTGVFAGGENSIAAYAIDPISGKTSLIQHENTRGIHPRTFSLDPSGRILVAANMEPIQVKEGATLRTIPASLSVFRIGEDGRLTYVRKYDVDAGKASMFWMGMVGQGESVSAR